MSEFNELIVLSQNKKKGDGVNAVLKLMQDTRDFQDKLQVCLEAQAIAENKAKIEEINDYIDRTYDVLLGIASGGIRSIREKQIETEEKGEKQPVIVNAPTVPKM